MTAADNPLTVSEHQLDLALKTGKIGTWQLDLAIKTLITSAQCKANYGVPVDADFTHPVLIERIHPDDRGWVTAAIENTIVTGDDYDVEYRTVWDDGSTHWVIARAYLSRDEAGKPNQMIGISINITGRKQAEETTKESERRLRRVVESGMFGVMFAGTGGEITYANQYIANLLGYSVDEFTSGQVRWDELTPPEFVELDRQAIAQARSYGTCAPYKKAYWHRDGRQVPVLVAGTMLQEPFSQSQEAIGFILDLTDLERMTQEREHFFNLSNDLYAIANAKGYFTYANSAWESVMGFKPTELYAELYMDFVHPDDKASTAEAAQVLSEGRTLIGFDNRYRTKDGRYRWLSWSVSSLPPYYEEFYCVARDVTMRKAAEDEKEQLFLSEKAAREAAERANRIKDEFLAVVSHELRSPLNPILGWSQLLQKGKLGPEQTKTALETIERNARLQVQLIGDLLDISRILRGKLSLDKSPVEISEIIISAVETVRQAAEQKNIKVTITKSPCMVIGDAGRLQQVVWNLLSNAVKFTPEGGEVKIAVAVEENYANVQVTDTGKGIKAEFLPYVFEHFRQEDYSTTRQFGGLGLGLAIVRQVVDMHDGHVTVESPGENKGAIFTVQLPLAAVPDSLPLADAKAAPASLNGVHILVIDDEPDSREITSFVLEQANANVTVVASGQEALAALRDRVPDMLISDVGMPGMDGYMLMREIRQRPPELGGAVLAIALTAYAGDRDQQQSLAAGYHRHVTKPIDPSALIAAINDLLSSIAS